MAEIVIDLGPITMHYIGEYNSATQYVAGDVVSYNGCSFVYLQNSTGTVPIADGVIAFKLADKGEKGDKGDTGVQGVQGAKGDKGDTGVQGPAGADGTVTFDALTDAQKASLKGEKGDAGVQGLQGEKGDKGDKGDTGAAGIDGNNSLSEFISGSCAVTTLTSLPITKRLIVASLSTATDISLASALAIGQELLIRCTPSVAFTQPLPSSNGWSCLDGSSIDLIVGKVTEISILCYATDSYSIAIKQEV